VPAFWRTKRLTHQTGHALPQRVIEAFDVIGFPSVLRDGFVLGWWNHILVGLVLIRMEYNLLAASHGDIGPQLFGTVTTAITNMKRNNLARLGVHGNPDPLPMGLLLHKAPHLISFGFQPSEHHVCWIDRQLGV
jgi:hypothetical protein